MRTASCSPEADGRTALELRVIHAERRVRHTDMPELPEVETIKRDLENKLPGLTVREVNVLDGRVVKDIPPKTFIRKIKGKKIKSVARRGKALVLEFVPSGFLAVQLKMTGQLIYGPFLAQTKVAFKLSNSDYLNYNDQRTLGWLIYVDRLEEIPYLESIGPEPLTDGFNPSWLKAALKKRTGPIKPLLMNHQFVAGIGNIYASEILFQARIHPRRKSKSLTAREVDQLHASTVRILNEAIRLRGSSMRDYRDAAGEKGNFNSVIKVYGRKDEDCPDCKRPIERTVQSGRSTFFCPQCQPYRRRIKTHV